MKEKEYDIIILSGGFDPPHVGHIRMIQDAASRCDWVIVGANSDEWLMRKKGYVFMKFEERLEMLRNIKNVRFAAGFDDNDDTASDLIKNVRKMHPDRKIAFGNGGDRKRENTPEMKACVVERVDMIWGVGGDNKAQSSSTLVETAREKQ